MYDRRAATRVPAGSRRHYLALLLGLFGAMGVQAQETRERFPETQNYFSFGLVHTRTDSARGTNYGNGGVVGFAGRLDGRRWWEARIFSSILETGTGAAVDFYQSGLGVDFIQALPAGAYGQWFGLLGVGVTINDVLPANESGTGLYYNGGIGWRAQHFRIWDLRPRLEVRSVFDNFGPGFTDLQLGVTFEFPPHPLRVVEHVREVEKVEEVEVPVRVEDVTRARGVCVVAVNLDSDGDGVEDALDRCPDTLQGARVDAEGCVLREAQTVTLPSVEFELGAAVLAPAGREILDTVVAFMGSQPDVRVQVLGHTDAQGAAAYNQQLSENRAQSVVNYLVSRGIGAGRLESRGYGESQPVASNDTASGRARNRRVELRISVGD